MARAASRALEVAPRRRPCGTPLDPRSQRVAGKALFGERQAPRLGRHTWPFASIRSAFEFPCLRFLQGSRGVPVGAVTDSRLVRSRVPHQSRFLRTSAFGAPIRKFELSMRIFAQAPSNTKQILESGGQRLVRLCP